MKKNLIALTAAFITLFEASGNMNVHQPANNWLEKTMQSIEKLTNATSRGLPREIVLVRAAQDFAHRYPTIDNVRWDQNNQGATGDFFNKSIKTKVFYDARGSWTGQLKSYPVTELEESIRKIVKERYYDYTIKWIHEAESPESLGIPTYIFTLDGIKDFKTVRLFDGDMEVLNEIEK